MTEVSSMLNKYQMPPKILNLLYANQYRRFIIFVEAGLAQAKIKNVILL